LFVCCCCCCCCCWWLLCVLDLVHSTPTVTYVLFNVFECVLLWDPMCGKLRRTLNNPEINT
jgi:hypothetical protein